MWRHFVPLWGNFYHCQERASHQDYNNEDITNLKDIDEYLDWLLQAKRGDKMTKKAIMMDPFLLVRVLSSGLGK